MWNFEDKDPRAVNTFSVIINFPVNEKTTLKFLC